MIPGVGFALAGFCLVVGGEFVDSVWRFALDDSGRWRGLCSRFGVVALRSLPDDCGALLSMVPRVDFFQLGTVRRWRGRSLASSFARCGGALFSLVPRSGSLMVPGVGFALALAWSLCGRSLMIAGPCSRWFRVRALQL